MFLLLKKYWNSYGGCKSLLCSPFIWFALFVTFLSQNFWSHTKWIDMPIAMLPSLVGFNLASYSIWLAFGNQKLNRILAKDKEGRKYSIFMEVNASFIHFILAQVLCLIFIILIKTIDLSFLLNFSIFSCSNNYFQTILFLEKLFNGFSFFIFIYSLGCMLAAILGFIGIASGLDAIYRKEYEDEKKIKNESKLISAKLFELEKELELVKNENKIMKIKIDTIKKSKFKINLFSSKKNR